jgi:hypothetical protein
VQHLLIETTFEIARVELAQNRQQSLEKNVGPVK